jgi:hypothetical protein
MYLSDFNEQEEKISYSIEDENGDRIDNVTLSISNIEEKIVNMDFFLLSYLPKLMSKGYNITVLGPLSNDLVNILDSMQINLIRAGIHPFAASTIHVVSVSEKDCNIKYNKKDIIIFAEEYLKNNDLNDTLYKILKYYT